jgi:hypothetical protein
MCSPPNWEGRSPSSLVEVLAGASAYLFDSVVDTRRRWKLWRGKQPPLQFCLRRNDGHRFPIAI